MILFRLMFLYFCVYQCRPCDAKTYEADFIIVGAGAAGSAVAARLSEDGKHTVLLLEAGGEPEHYNDIPYFSQEPYDGKIDWQIPLTHDEVLCNNASRSSGCVFHQGKGLGGSTLINSMVYARGNMKDFDHWRELGNEGWGFEDVLPFFKKFENYRVNVSAEDEQFHGVGGPVDIMQTPYYPELSDAFLEANEELGYKEVDFNGKQQKGFSRGFYTLRDGLRFSAFKAYLENARQRQNLRILTNALVHKVEFDDKKRAVGVVFEYKGKEIRARAKKEVIISTGAVYSPKILQLSGIGSKQLLNKLKIPVVHESRGVGENLQNQIWASGLSILLKDNIGFDISKDVTAANLAELETQGQGPLTVSFQSVGISFVDSEYADKSVDWPDLEMVIFQPMNKLKFPCGHPLNGFENFVEIFPAIMRPKSVGRIMINSSNAHDPPDIQFNYLSEVDDVNVLVSGVKIARQLGATKALQKLGAVVPPLTVLKPCENFDVSSDEYLECFVRKSYATSYHVTGTCKMGVKDDTNAVVDEKLRVYGVSNLRVIDNSVSPTTVTGHTMGVSYMIAEKGADMVLQDWKKNRGDLLG